MVEGTTRRTYDDAVLDCAKRGLKLAYPRNASELALFQKSKSFRTWYWLGINKADNGVWTNSDNLKQDYFSWKSGQPNGRG